MKTFLLFAFVIISIVAKSQQIGGSGCDNGYYHSHISVYLAADSTTSLSEAGVWYSANARLTDGTCTDFIIIPGHGLKYTRNATLKFIFQGDSDSYGSKSATVTYGLFINSSASPVSGGETDRYFHNANEHEGFSINREITLNYNDTIKVKFKSNQASTDITVTQLNLSICQLQ